MIDTLLTQFLIPVIVGLIASVIGAALWEKALRHSWERFSSYLIRIISLGRKSSRDSMYFRAANSLHVDTAASVKGTLFFILFAAYFGASLVFLLLFDDRIGIDCLFVTGQQEFVECTANSLEEIKPTKTLSEARWNFFYFAVVSFSTMLLTIYSMARQNKIADLQSDFLNALDLAGPHISDQERLVFRQQFVKILTKEQYDELMKTLSDRSSPNVE